MFTNETLNKKTNENVARYQDVQIVNHGWVL